MITYSTARVYVYLSGVEYVNMMDQRRILFSFLMIAFRLGDVYVSSDS
jgi:hypothetical protein